MLTYSLQCGCALQTSSCRVQSVVQPCVTLLNPVFTINPGAPLLVLVHIQLWMYLAQSASPTTAVKPSHSASKLRLVCVNQANKSTGFGDQRRHAPVGRQHKHVHNMQWIIAGKAGACCCSCQHFGTFEFTSVASTMPATSPPRISAERKHREHAQQALSKHLHSLSHQTRYSSATAPTALMP